LKSTSPERSAYPVRHFSHLLQAAFHNAVKAAAEIVGLAVVDAVAIVDLAVIAAVTVDLARKTIHPATNNSRRLDC
jgi:hypothetical protein